MPSGLIYQAQENHAAANNEFRRAVDLSPRSADAHWHLAGALARLGRSAEAARHYRRVAELEPGTERARNATQEIHKKTARKKGDK